MRFAVHARPLLNPITGIARYLREVMREVERDGRFEPEYFFATRWHQTLGAPAAGPALSPGLVNTLRSLPPLTALARSMQQHRFEAGVRSKGLQFYFEPNYLPFDTDVPTIITIHDISHLRHPETHPRQRVEDLSRLLPRAVEKASCILTVSEFTRREVMSEFGVDPSRVIATPLGVEPRFYPRDADATHPLLAPLGLTHGHYVLSVGTLEPRKNVLATLRAHGKLPAKLRDQYPLVVAGKSGWLTEALDRELAAGEARGDVHRLGHVGDEQLPLLYAGATLLAYPSLYEGFGLPPLEAMASGVPVIASNRASLPEVVGDAGIQIDPDDVDGLAASMRRIIEDAEFARDLSERGLARARTFTWRRCAELTMQAWERALGSR